MVMSLDSDKAVLARLPGGEDLIRWFGAVPSVHDAEIVELSLRRRAPSILRVHTWITRPEVDRQGYYVQDKHVVVSFELEDIIDLQLEGFSHQNVVFGLTLLSAADRPDRLPYYWLDPSPNDVEIELEPCF